MEHSTYQTTITVAGFCPTCGEPVPVYYEVFKKADGRFQFLLVGNYPVHLGKCATDFEKLKRHRGGISA